jgi:hypothetical protein
MLIASDRTGSARRRWVRLPLTKLRSSQCCTAGVSTDEGFIDSAELIRTLAINRKQLRLAEQGIAAVDPNTRARAFRESARHDPGIQLERRLALSPRSKRQSAHAVSANGG